MYVIRYVDLVLRSWPDSHPRQVVEGFSEYFRSDCFSPEDVRQGRLDYLQDCHR
jgi:hypothetical protein